MISSLFSPSNSPLLLTFFLLLLHPVVHASVYFQNETYASLPALFGKLMSEDTVYQARLQFLRENPYLCDQISSPSTFVEPPASSSTNSSVVLLAARGECSFQRKAEVAQQLESVDYLIVYNYNYDSEDTLVPMYSEFGDTRLVLLSVTHRTGQTLKRYIASQEESVLEQGGPFVGLDSLPPEGLMSIDDLQNMLLSAFGFLMMLISLSGCIMVLAGTYGHVQQQHQPSRRLLTIEQVHSLPKQVPERTNDEDFSCAVCFESFESEVPVTVLPCQHYFHTECIGPWLTERQAKCPLCKHDVSQHVEDQEWTWFWMLRRRRWTRVQTSPPPLAPMIEMTEQEDDATTTTR